MRYTKFVYGDNFLTGCQGPTGLTTERKAMGARKTKAELKPWSLSDNEQHGICKVRLMNVVHQTSLSMVKGRGTQSVAFTDCFIVLPSQGFFLQFPNLLLSW